MIQWSLYPALYSSYMIFYDVRVCSNLTTIVAISHFIAPVLLHIVKSSKRSLRESLWVPAVRLGSPGSSAGGDGWSARPSGHPGEVVPQKQMSCTEN